MKRKRKLFDELSMNRVLEQISADLQTLPPEMKPIEGAELSPQQQGARILGAHETLSSLSEDNRAQFQAVVESMRADLHEES